MKKPLLYFNQTRDNTYNVFNHEDNFLGNITKARVGKFIHWIFSPDNKTYFTNGCLKEIVEFITKLYNKDRKELKKSE